MKLLDNCCMYFPDFSPYSYNLHGLSLPGVQCVGWLDEEHPYLTGKLPMEFLDRLLNLLRTEQVRIMRGLHYCPFCNEEYVQLEERKILLGHAEIWVPSPTREVVFAAPTLMYHYCEMHEYRPPDEFVEAVLTFDVSSGWSASDEARKRVREIFQDE